MKELLKDIPKMESIINMMSMLFDNLGGGCITALESRQG